MKLRYKLVIVAFVVTVIGSFIWSAGHYYSKYQHEKERADEAVRNAESATAITRNVLQSLQIVNTVLEANPISEESTETAARQHIGPLAPVAGSDLYVFRPVAHTVDFHIRVTPDTPEIRAAITAELRSFLLRDGYPQGELKVSRISEAISGANGEYSHQLLAPADNISIAKNELAVLGTISWT